uniref:Maturation n=1 Tax=Leviviridae sp. TaxID=2027243 RepID=A0A514D8A9_9VIRU|nr:MAG: hypothetical protein H4BulkL22317e12091_000001 [Leviviridae sp.]
MAQGAQTVSLIADLSVRLAKTFLQLKKLRLADAVSTLKAPLKTLLPLTRQKMANDFLAYRYGIAPLIGDIQGMAEYIASIVLSEQKIKAAGTSTKYADFVDTGFLGAIIPYKIFRSSKVTVKHNVRFRVNDKLSKAAEELGFTNPANVLWELVPFSFVVDWFLPIGNFLNSMNALEHLTVVDVTRTTVIEEFLFFQLDPSPYELPIDDRNKVNISGLNCLTRNFCCVREVIPTPNLPLPTFKNPLSTGHIANAIALMSQLLKR